MSYTSDANAKARHGLHGMLLFSDGDALYASHLPMFHAPHDVQLIFRFTLVDKKVESELAKALGADKPYCTLAPQKFDLNLLGSKAKNGIWQFSADLFAGHFERKGKLTYKTQIVKVEQVIVNQILDRKQPKVTEFKRITPTNAKRHFYARIIAGKPGVDHLVVIASNKTLPERLTMNSSELTINEVDIAAQLGLATNQVSLYYQEFGDLK